MNKTININLGGMPFVIDDEAYARLDNYLNALERHFSNSEGFEEIIGDIEARIAEIFHKKLNGRNIVQEDDVIHSIAVMGTPDDFGEMAEEMAADDRNPNWQTNTGKKLYRDTDDKVIGGVCSGLAAYFGVDTIWVRIGFAFVFFTMGFGLILYLIMWAIVPEAITSGDRLAMRGEKIDVKNIAKNVEAGIENLSETLQGFGEGIRQKKKRKGGTTAGNSRHARAERFSILDDDPYLDDERPRRRSNIRKAFKGTFIFLVVLILISVFFAWIALLVSSLGFGHATSFILPWDGGLSYALAIPMFLLISVPLFSIARSIIRSIRPAQTHRRTGYKWVSGTLTFLAFVGFFGILSLTGRHFKSQETVKSELLSFDSPNATINVDIVGQNNRKRIFRNDLFNLGKDHLTIKHMDFNVTKSPDEKWHLISIIKSRGYNVAECEQAAKSIDLDYTFEEHKLEIGNGYELGRHDKFRGQELTYELQVPEGGKLDFDPTSLRKVPCEAFPDHELHNDLLGKVFEMGDEKLVESTDEDVIGVN